MMEEVKYYPFKIGGVEQKYPNVHPGTPKYASCMQIGNLLFVSGMTAQELETGAVFADNITDQMNIVMDKIRAVLEEAGSSMENIVKTLMLLKDVKDYQIMRKVELEYYQQHAPRLVEEPPASTFMEVTLANPAFLVEIEVVAVVKRG